MIKEELLDRTVVGTQYVTNGPSTYQMANLLRHVFHMVASAFNLLRHKQDMKAIKLSETFRGFKVTKGYDIAKTVDFRISPEDIDGLVQRSGAEGDFDVSQHSLQLRGHHNEIADIVVIHLRRNGFCTIDKTQQKIADSLEGDSEFHAGKQGSGFLAGDSSDGGGYEIVDIAIQRVQLALVIRTSPNRDLEDVASPSAAAEAAR